MKAPKPWKRGGAQASHLEPGTVAAMLDAGLPATALPASGTTVVRSMASAKAARYRAVTASASLRN